MMDVQHCPHCGKAIEVACDVTAPPPSLDTGAPVPTVTVTDEPATDEASAPDAAQDETGTTAEG